MELDVRWGSKNWQIWSAQMLRMQFLIRKLVITQVMSLVMQQIVCFISTICPLFDFVRCVLTLAYIATSWASFNVKDQDIFTNHNTNQLFLFSGCAEVQFTLVHGACASLGHELVCVLPPYIRHITVEIQLNSLLYHCLHVETCAWRRFLWVNLWQRQPCMLYLRGGNGVFLTTWMLC